MNRNLELRYPKRFNSIFYFILLGVLSVFAVVPMLEAAITQTGNVEPGGAWSSSTTGYVGNSSYGSLTVDAGSILQSQYAYIAHDSGVSGAATVTGSMWTNSSSLYVGYYGNGTLNLEAGGWVRNFYDGFLGYNSGSSGAATVTGTGSMWTNSGSLDVGYYGNGTLNLEAGGRVSNSYGFLGYNSGSSGAATVTGTGSMWTNSGSLNVGYSGTGTLRIEAGGQVSNSYGYLGNSSGSSGAATVTGTGSKWTNSGSLNVGYSGTGTLRVEEGGQVSNSYDGYLGYLSGSSGTATITGAGSKWTTTYQLFVGKYGVGTLRIEAGGQVSNSYGYLGKYSGSSGAATVTGAGSKWTNSSDLFVGYDGAGTLTVADGGEVTAKTLYASLQSLFGNGTITAQGAILDADLRFDAAHAAQQTLAFGSGGTLTVSAAGGSLGAGYKGNGSLTVTEGVAVTSSYGYLGYRSGSSGAATVTGTGSTWTNSIYLYVGNYGAGTLRIESGGQVSNSYDGYLGYRSGSSGAATVTGTGSKWTNNSSLYVGYDGAGMLTVADGGEVTAKTLYASLENLFGNGTITAQGAVLDADLRFDAAHAAQQTFAFGSGGTLTVSAAGGSLGAGHKGNGSLTVAEGVAVTSYAGCLGYLSGSSGTATITGIGSKWTNSNYLYVGNYGTGTLRVEAGGQVSNSSGYLGCYSGSSGTAMITGAGSQWNNYSLYVGDEGAGTLRIEKGGQVSSSYGYLGYLSGSSGTATITGTHSMWTTNNGYLFVGYSGTGTLRIEAGGQVSNSYDGYLGYRSGSSGAATVTGAGSKWTNSSDLFVGYDGAGTLTVADGGEVTAETLYASLQSLFGNGTITAQGAILDADLRFDAAHAAQQTFAFGSGGTLTVSAARGSLGAGYKGNGSLTVAEGVAVTSSSGYLGNNSGSSGTATITGAGSMWTNRSSLYVGNSGAGTLRIEVGGQVSNFSGYLGNNSGSSGMATVTGAGSKWTNTYLYVGSSGAGTLRVEEGGQVSNYYDGYLGYNAGSSGTATVTGTGSMWTNSGTLSVGNSGSGTLHIRDGGMVTARSVSVNSSSLLTIDAGYGSNLRIGSSGTGTITNSGKIRLLTGPQPAAGNQYSPITAGTWSGSGTYQAIGGTWNTTSHAFTVSQTLTGTSGTSLAIDLAQRQRVLVNDSTNGWSVGSSFLAKTGTGKSFSLTATTVAGTNLAALNGMLEPGQSVLSGWNFTAVGSGYIASDPVYVSLGIPAILSHGNVQLWRFNSGSWSRFTADDLTANDGYASFTSIGLSNYAISAALPVAAWKADVDGLWQNGANWTTDPNAPGGINVAAALGPAITVPRTVSLGGPLTLGVLTFNSGQHYTLAGTESLNLQVNQGFIAEIDVQASDKLGHVIETPVTVSSPLEISIAPSACLTLSGQVQNPTGQTLTLTGGGTLAITQGLVTTGAINVEAGTLTTPSLRADTLNIGSTSVAAVPEPSMVFLLLAAMVAIVGLIAKK